MLVDGWPVVECIVAAVCVDAEGSGLEFGVCSSVSVRSMVS